MVSTRLRYGPPSWVVVDNGEVDYDEPSDRMNKDEIIEEILDNGEDRSPPNPYSPDLVAKTIRNSSPLLSPSSFEQGEDTKQASPSSCRLSRGRRIAPLLTCLHGGNKSRVSEEQQQDDTPPSLEIVSSDQILSDLEKDPRLSPTVLLPDCLIFGVLVVRDASTKVNGVYHCTGMVDSVGHYTKTGRYKNRKVTFSIFRCMHADSSRRWYLSICSKKFEPGTKHDTDFYAALATGAREEVPPTDGWRVVVGSGVAGNAPKTMWIPHESRVQPCSVCFEQPVSHVLVPCGHACLCQGCAKAVSRREIRMCPEGRCPIDDCVRLYGTVVDNDAEEDEPKQKASRQKRGKKGAVEPRRVML